MSTIQNDPAIEYTERNTPNAVWNRVKHLAYYTFTTRVPATRPSYRTLTQDLKGKQSAVEKPFHDLVRRLDARERELTQLASEGAKLSEAAADLEAFVAAKKAEIDSAPPISAKIDKLRDQVGASGEAIYIERDSANTDGPATYTNWSY